MEQILRLINSLTLKQKITIVIVAAAVIAGLMSFMNWNKERDFAPLFTGLATEDAGAMVTRLKESGVEYRLAADGSSIRVPSEKVADLRLQMAAAGLPKTGRIGFELFDKTTFGVTEFAEKINYHRALEGELERSVMSLAEVESARVHITLSKESVFLERRQPAKASVLVKLRPGRQMAPPSVQAVTQLLASAVEGLAPEMVAVVDVNGRLLSRARRQDADREDQAGEAHLEYRRGVERDLMAKVNSTLEPLLGADKFRAGVSVECDFTSGEQSEETYDPSKSVMTTSQRTEDVAGGTLASGVAGTASNLPRPTSRPGSSTQGVSRRTENVAYQSSRVVRRLQLPQGTVKRISVSVLLDHNVRFEGTGPKPKRIVEPPSPERIKTTRDLIAGIVGLQPDRGDQLIVETLPFESTLNWEPPPPAAPAPAPRTAAPTVPKWLAPLLEGRNLVLVAAGAGGVLVLLGIAVFALRRKKKRRGGGARVEGPAEVASQETPALPPSESLDEKIKKQFHSQLAARQKEEDEILKTLRLPQSNSKKGEVLAKHLADENKKTPKVLAQIVRTWMAEGEN